MTVICIFGRRSARVHERSGANIDQKQADFVTTSLSSLKATPFFVISWILNNNNS